ncbi:MAG: hypothetical protein SFU25_07465 [Candidatus Caenarcaniphilales bacterium]|nr:hypothetical protein [Candidatus Caenarcaniphilales bacterium]
MVLSIGATTLASLIIAFNPSLDKVTDNTSIYYFLQANFGNSVSVCIPQGCTQIVPFSSKDG